MKVRLNKNEPNAAQRKVLKQECKKEFFNLLEMYNKQVSLQIMHILHFDFGFGKKRLRKFFEKLKTMQQRLIDRYELTDNDVPDICEIQLRDAGINFEDFFEFDKQN
jgi:hypothetical protein